MLRTTELFHAQERPGSDRTFTLSERVQIQTERPATFSVTHQEKSGLSAMVSHSMALDPSGDSSLISIASLSTATFQGTGNLANGGHFIGAVGHAVMSAAGRTSDQAIGCEGKLTVNAGTVTNGQGMQANLEIPSGTTVNSAYGLLALMNTLAGTVGVARGVGIQFENITGVTGNVEGVTVLAPMSNGGSGFLGFQCSNYTGNGSYGVAFYTTMASGAGRASLRSAADAPMRHRGTAAFGVDAVAASGATVRVDDGGIDLELINEPSAPDAGWVRIYADQADGNVYGKDSSSNLSVMTSFAS